MNIIDFHTHIYPSKIADKAVKSVGDFYNIDMTGNGIADSLIRQGSKAGVDAYVVHSVAVTKNTVRAINDFISSECKLHNEFFGFGTLHADFEDKISECERIKELNLCGLKLHPDTQCFYIDDEKMFEVYDFLSQNNMPLLVHTGDYRYDFSHPRRFKRVLENFPKLTAIGAHFGGWSMFDLAYEYLADMNCYVDTSSSYFMLGMKRAKELIRLYGAERVLFGSDFPMWNSANELELFYSMKLNDDENELILHKNAERILGIND